MNTVLDPPDSLIWDDLLGKLAGFTLLKSGWDSYKAAPPNALAIAQANHFFCRLREAGQSPARCAPSVVGGVGVTLRKGSREIYVEFYNNGAIHGLLSDEATRQMEDAALAADTASHDAFIARAQGYLNA